jgi:hypothetical protein
MWIRDVFYFSIKNWVILEAHEAICYHSAYNAKDKIEVIPHRLKDF